MSEEPQKNEPAAILALRSIEADIKKVAEENERLAFDYSTPAGEKEARSQIHSLRSFNGQIDRRYSELTADLNNQKAMLLEAKKSLKEKVAEMIAVHNDPLIEKAEREAAREAAIQKPFDSMQIFYERMSDEPTADEIRECIAAIVDVDVSEDVTQERHEEALATKKALLGESGLAGMLAKREKADAEAAELLSLREKAAKLEKEANDRRIADEAAAAAKAEAAEERRIEDERREQALENERAESRRRTEAAEAEAERLRVEAAEAELRREEEEEARKTAEVERIAREKREREAKEARAMREKADREAEEKAAEEARRASEEHRKKVEDEFCDEIEDLLMSGTLTDLNTAKSVALLVYQSILIGSVPHAQITS